MGNCCESDNKQNGLKHELSLDSDASQYRLIDFLKIQPDYSKYKFNQTVMVNFARSMYESEVFGGPIFNSIGYLRDDGTPGERTKDNSLKDQIVNQHID